MQTGPPVPKRDLQQLLERGELAQLGGEEGRLAAARLSAAEIISFRFHGIPLRRLLSLADFLGVNVEDHVEQDYLRAGVQPGPENFKGSYCWEGKPYSSLYRSESLSNLISLEYLSLE